MTESEYRFVAFYSWQSDLPGKTNRNGIRAALRVASIKLEEQIPDKQVVIDEATRGVAGSPNIPATILEKIRTCDVFICDITTINAVAPEELRRTPNPNVAFELGYALANVGWERIIMLFNTAFGTLKDVPFDFDRHRIVTYELSESEEKKKGILDALASTLAQGILDIARQNPEKPKSGALPLGKEIRRSRDIRNLTWILSTVHFPTVDQMIEDLPHMINSRAIHFWEDFNGIYQNSLFHIYDKELAKLLAQMHAAWEVCVSNGAQYRHTNNSSVYIFDNPNQAPFTASQERVWKKINKARGDLLAAKKDLLKRVRKKYLEVEVNETNKSAWTRYVEEEAEMERTFGLARAGKAS